MVNYYWLLGKYRLIERWVRSRDAVDAFDDLKQAKDAPLSQTLKVSLFFLPHVIFRSSALAFTAAFLGYFALIPISLAVTIVFGTCCHLYIRTMAGGDTMYTLIATVFAPIAVAAGRRSDRTLMKRAITIFTIILLMCLTFIRLLPIMVQPDNLVSTYGLRHLNFAEPSGVP